MPRWDAVTLLANGLSVPISLRGEYCWRAAFFQQPRSCYSLSWVDTIFFVRVCPCVQMAETKGIEPGQVGFKAVLSEPSMEATTAAAVRTWHRPGEGQQGCVKRCFGRGELGCSHWNAQSVRFGGRENLDYRSWKHSLSPLFSKCWWNFGDCRGKQIVP